MPVRTSTDELRKLLNCSAEAEVQVFITMANTTVDTLLGSSTLSDAAFKLIETFLAAHYYTLTNERGALAAETVGDTTERYHNTYSKGFGSTRYGQQAMAFDTTGILASESAKADSPVTKKAEFRVL